ncbi:MAG: hypothetical protein ACFB2Z_13345 [Maricaulaceae bacterium]
MSKSAYAAHAGVTPGRVSHLIEDGLPVLGNGRIPVTEADAWRAANTQRYRNRSRVSTDELAKARLAKEQALAEMARLDADRKARKLVDRKAVETAIEARARGEREAHMGFVARAAQAIAAETGADPRAVFAALDRAMRDHLARLADTPLDPLLSKGEPS